MKELKIVFTHSSTRKDLLTIVGLKILILDDEGNVCADTTNVGYN